MRQFLLEISDLWNMLQNVKDHCAALNALRRDTDDTGWPRETWARVRNRNNWNTTVSIAELKTNVKNLRRSQQCDEYLQLSRYQAVRLTGRQADRPTGRQADRPTGRRADGPTGRRADGPTGRRADGPISRRADGPTGRRADRPTGRQADRLVHCQTGRLTGWRACVGVSAIRWLAKSLAL